MLPEKFEYTILILEGVIDRPLIVGFTDFEFPRSLWRSKKNVSKVVNVKNQHLELLDVYSILHQRENYHIIARIQQELDIGGRDRINIPLEVAPSPLARVPITISGDLYGDIYLHDEVSIQDSVLNRSNIG